MPLALTSLASAMALLKCCSILRLITGKLVRRKPMFLTMARGLIRASLSVI